LGYSFERHETVAVGVGRIIGELTWTTTQELYPSHPRHQDWVHNTRTRYKRIRSLLRLMRDSLGDDVYRAEMDRIREATGLLSRLRDAEVLVQTADLLAEHIAEDDSLAQLRQWLGERYRQISHIETNIQQLLLTTAREMDELILRSANWQLPEDYDEPLREFTRSYNRGLQQMGVAFEQPGDEAFHDWRKRVKGHYYQCCLFDMAWSPTMSLRSEEIKSLSDLLGEDHDIAVLREVLAAETGAPEMSQQLDRQVHDHQQGLRDRSKTLAESVYQHEPDALADELRRSIERWH
jgi:CHAD domain-containing protein